MSNFLSELMAEKFRTGKLPKPNPNNPVTLKRIALANALKRVANNFDTHAANAEGMQLVVDNIGQIQKYVTSKGEVPLNNPAELATQAYILKQKEIHDYAKALNVSPKVAQIYMDEAEANEQEINSPNADYFLGALVDALGQAVAKPLQKLADKRVAKGKKPGFVGFLANAVNQPVQQVKDDATTAAANAASTAINQPKKEGGNFLDGLMNIGKDIFTKVRDNEKQSEIKKMLPTIILIAVVVIALTVIITAYATKRK